MSEKICIRYYISGKVQGVWFRANTKEKALHLQLTGYVRNLPDGRVEVLACGDQEKIAELQAWLNIGPKHAEVTHLEYQPMKWQEYQGFEIL